MTGRTTTEAPAIKAGAFGPSPYGLTRPEIRAELRRLSDCGWQLWELRLRFGTPDTWGAALVPTSDIEKEVSAW